jgi:hypothetical protein
MGNYGVFLINNVFNSEKGICNKISAKVFRPMRFGSISNVRKEVYGFFVKGRG